MDKEPLVSIIVPIYNVEKYVEQCLDSIVNQTYTNLEVILVNDGSNDASVEKIKYYLTDPRVLLKSQNNQGLSAARNRGLQKATGKYVLFIDSDDYGELNMVEQLVRQLEEQDANLIRFNADAFSEEEVEGIKTNNYDFSHRLRPKRLYLGKEALKANRRSFSPSACLYMVKRSLLEEHAIVFPKGLLHEDEWFTTLVFLYANRLVYDNHFYYHRRYRAASIMTSKTEEKEKQSFESYMLILKRMHQLLTKTELNPAQNRFIKRQMLSIYNGLLEAQVEVLYKKEKLKEIDFVDWKDKAFLRLARWKNK